MAKEISSFSVSDVYRKKNRRRRRIILGLIFLLSYGIFIGMALLVVRSPLLQIQKIEINGTKSILNEDILALVNRKISYDSFWKQWLSAQNILSWPNNFSSDDLKLIPQLKALSLKKDYQKRSIDIEVEERKPFGVWCSFTRQRSGIANPLIQENPVNDSPLDASSSEFEVNSEQPCWWFDNQGVLFTKSLNVEGNLITVVDDYSQKNLGVGSNILPSEFIPNIFSIFKVVSAGDFSIKEIRLNDISLQEVEVDTYASSPAGVSEKIGTKLYFSLRFPADNALAVIHSLKSKSEFEKLQYIDFRLENRAYYK